MPCFRSTVNRASSRELWALSKKVFCCVGVTSLMELKASPSRPSLFVSWVKELDTVLADSTAWPVTLRPPTVTTSV